MTARLLAVVVLEACLCAFFGWQLADAAEPMPVPSHVGPSTAPTSGAAAPASATVATSTSTPAESTRDAKAAERTTAARKWTANDPIGVLLTGNVTFRDGSAVTDPSVYVKQDDAGHSASTNNGCYAILGLAPGTWTATVRAEGAIDVEQTFEITDDAEQRHDFVLERSYPVRVFCTTPDGKDFTKALREAGTFVFDLHVIGQREPFPDRLAPTDYGIVWAGDAKWEGRMNGRGKQKPADDAAGTLHLAAPPPAHAALMLRHVVIQQQRIEAGQKEVRFVVDPATWQSKLGTVTLRVVDADSRAPLTEAQVSLNSSSTGGGGQKCDAEGRVVLKGAQPGLLFVEIRAKDHEQYQSTIRIEPGQSLDLGDVAVGPTAELTGRVEDENGRPVPTANVTWTELKWRTGPTEFVTNRSTQIEADGTFKLWGTGRGKIAVQARTKEGAVACAVFDNPSPTPAVLRMVRGAKVEVTRNVDPTRAFTITFFDAQRQPVDARTLESRWPRIPFVLPPGSYGFEVHDEADRLVQSGSVTLGATPAKVEIR